MPRHLQFIAISVAFCLLGSACNKEENPAVAAQGAGGGAAGNGGGRSGSGRGGGRGGGGLVPVTTALVQNKSIPVTIPSVGSAEALQTVQVRAQVTGQLSTVHFTEGQEVHKGQELFTIDARPFQAALSQAEAVLARDTATANNAQSQRARSEDLYKRQLISRDQYESQAATADAAQATLAADRAAIETARLNLQYTHIVAAIGGRTGTLGVHQGDLVRANDTNPMVVINQLAPIYVTFSVPGRYLTDIRRYQAQKSLAVHASGQAALPPGAQPPPPPVIGSLQAPPSGSPGGQPPVTGAQPQQEYSGAAAKAAASAGITAGIAETGRVTFIDNAVDATTGTIKLKATFENSDRALWPGQFLQITLDLTTENNAIVVPAAAVQPSQSGQFVYVVKADSSVEVRPVVILRQQGEQMVIAQGLTPGEVVVTEGQLRLTPGAKVTTGGGRGGNPEEPGAGTQNGGSGRGGRRGSRRGNAS